MEYYHILDLKKEPFSNSPDPEFFFECRMHVECIQKIELSVRLGRGLNVITGEVGTGKTTLCRYFIKKFAADDKLETHLILDPSFSSPQEFLTEVCRMFLGYLPENNNSLWKLKENIKRYLFQKGVEEKRTVVLIIDEGQKLPDFCIELLREFLNYETNEFKLLQTVIFAQKEFMHICRKHENFADRISTQFSLRPFDFKETKALIKFRMSKAGGGKADHSIFSPLGLWGIYRATRGYPRRIIHLCHTIILGLIIQNRAKAGLLMARSCAKRIQLESPLPKKRTAFLAFAGLLAVLILLARVPDGFKVFPTLEKDKGAFTKNPLEPAATTIKEDLTATQRRLPLRAEMTEGKSIAPQDREFALENAGEETRDYPYILGEITAGKQDTLGKMIKNVYGVFNDRYLDYVMEFNPRIMDPDVIEPGDVIRFPAVATIPGMGYTEQWYVEIARKSTLVAAYDYLKEISGLFPFFKIVPFWNEDYGLKFAVLCKQCFHDRNSAMKWLTDMPPSISSEGRLIKGWEPGTVFFASLPATAGK